MAPEAVAVGIARPRDASSLGAFFREAWKEAGTDSLGFTGATKRDIEEIASVGFLTKRLGDPSVRFVVAKRGGKMLGFASIRKLEGEKAELSGVIVRESETGMGVGTRLVHRAIKEAIGLRVAKMVVKTEVLNERAIRFYAKNGFVVKGKSAVNVGRTRVEVQILERDIDPIWNSSRT
jgi:ribosomal protein S18 acetylase RimI-like enzyme